MSISSFWYSCCLGALHDDRKDRTVLFWKSVPVTDVETVLSKLITAVWVAPAATIAMILAAQVFLLTVISGLVATRETLSIWPIWANSGLFTGLVELLVGYLIQGLWALPLYGWLLFISAAVNRLPFLWALLAPAALVALEALVGLTSGGARLHPRPPRLQGAAAGPRRRRHPRSRIHRTRRQHQLVLYRRALGGHRRRSRIPGRHRAFAPHQKRDLRRFPWITASHLRNL